MSATAQRSRTDVRPKPVHDIKLGKLKAAVWANETENGTRHNVTFCRLYKEGDQWKDSSSFGRDDLLALGELARQAYHWIIEQGSVATAT